MENIKIHPINGKILHRDVKPAVYTYKGISFTVNQPGWYPEEGDDDDDVILTQEDMKVSGQALRDLKARLKAEENNLSVGNIALA